MAKKVKLADIAQRTGVSTVTVSKALTGQKGVSEEMRERIKRLADEMGYVQPSKERRTGPERSYNIGLLVEESYIDKYDSFYLQMYQKVATKAMDAGCFTLMEVIDRQKGGEYTLPRLLREQKVDGIVILGKMPETFLTFLKRQSTLPAVYVDFTDEGQDVDAVVSDSFYGAYQLTNYLFQMGHERIAYVGTLMATSSITDRYLGYVKSMLEHGKKIREDWVIDDRDTASGYIDEVNFLKLPEDMPTAFVCNCDLTAGRMVNKLKENGYRVPEDVSVIGFDNLPECQYSYPRLTSISQHLEEKARCAGECLFSMLRGETSAACNRKVDVELVERQSVIARL